jgi:hypothetical protein
LSLTFSFNAIALKLRGPDEVPQISNARLAEVWRERWWQKGRAINNAI